MSNILNIVKKELNKIFSSPKLIFTTFIMSGLIMFVLYSAMGSVIGGVIDDANEVESIVYIENESVIFNEALKKLDESMTGDVKLNIKTEVVETPLTKEEITSLIDEKTIQLYIKFPVNYDSDYANGTLTTIEVFSNSSIMDSSIASQKIDSIVKILNPVVTTVTPNDLASESESASMMLASLLPMLIMIFIVAGAMGIGNDTIAGEKERGTISTLLMAPISKNEIVLGKISAAVILTILSAMGSFIGIVASIPNAGPLFGETGNVAFGFATYLQLFVIIVMTALISVSAFVTTSTLAKNAKEAANYSMPLYMGILMLNVITQFSQLGEVSQLAYLIPFYNSILGIKSALMQDLTTINLLCIIVSNIALFVVLSISTIKLFKNEKVMFGK